MTSEITMDYMDVVCNGKSANSTSKINVLKKEPINKATSNMNWLIYTMYARQEYQFCKEIIAQQLEENYDQEYLFFIKGLIARIEGELQESLRCLQKTIELNPMNYENFKEIGKTLFLLGRWRQALDVFVKAESLLQRADAEVYYYIGDLLCRNATHPRSNINEAKEYFHRAIQNGRQIESHQKLALIYKEENNFAKAIEILEHSLQIIPENVDVLTEIGILYLKVNDTKSAFEKLFQATKLDENCTKAIMALGAILQSKNDIDGALNKYKLVNTSTDDSAEIWNNIGLCFFKKKKFIAAISCLKKSTWTSPLNFSVLYNLGLVCLTAKQYASAYQCLSAAINLRPNYAECYMLLGVCFKNLNDMDNAYLAFERAAMLPEAIKNPLIYLNFAIHCYETGRIEQAQLNLSNFAKMTEQTNMRMEIGKAYQRLRTELSNYDDAARGSPEEDTTNDLENQENQNEEEHFQENLV
ncbi:Bardet-Biedl syndrome 4 protein homolog [Bradysia coprophila]|uniref:Bardet-Biedl syndrome 4 protein homolog n=1 Tax=Bradysia coprophila TaxID=38358 RepID=UPI00187D8891|nr:Bardet-Biedl syndrome 4 protein homolog [Bradysia coprophila]